MGAILPKRFEPIRLLQKDRESSTFTATDLRLGRNEVVVKIIGKAALAEDIAGVIDVLSWYEGLRHPYISEVLDAGLTPRHDLFSVRNCHPASEFFAAADMSSLKTLLAAVDFLYSRGRVHGAIKPSNIFAAAGVTRLADPAIGSKKALVEQEVRFTAPEVLGGASPTCDSDLYSLGAVLYRFYSGRDPFEDSDIESLKAKYIWASPRPLASVSHVSKTIADIVTDLIHKDSGRRRPAFEALKEELNVEPSAATRAPLTGMSGQIEFATKLLQEKAGLRVLLVEGPIGSGKSRFVHGVCSRASFFRRDRALAVCEAVAPNPYAALARRLVSLIDERGLSVGTPSLSRVRTFGAEYRHSLSRLEQEQIERDLVSLVASVGRQTRLALVFEDIDRGSKKMTGMLELLVQQANELDLSILITARPGGPPARTTRVLKEFLGERFHRLSLELLTSGDAESVSRLLANDEKAQTNAVRRAGGNPSFLEEYCRNPKASGTPPGVRKALSGMMGRLSDQVRPVAQVLSLFEEPVRLDVLSRIARSPEAELRESIESLRCLGLVDSPELLIRYPDGRALLQAIIPKTERVELHARCYEALHEAGSTKTILARHAFQGGLFDVAAALYLELARDAFAIGDYGTSADYYRSVVECRVKNTQISPLDPLDCHNFAKSYGHQGNKRRARAIIEGLLASPPVREDPEFVSRLYATLGSYFVGDSPKERVSLLRLAVSCLPDNSPQLVDAYLAVTIAYLTAGDLPAAHEALKAAEMRSDHGALGGRLEGVRGHLFLSQGHYVDAAECFSRGDYEGAPPGVNTNNLAVCIEHLGDLMRARELQLQALQLAESTDSRLLQIMSLGNLGAMESKLGNFAAAERFFGWAFSRLQSLRRQSEGERLRWFGVVHADAAMHFLQTGAYVKAMEYFRGSHTEAGSLPPSGFFIQLMRCEVHLAMGRGKVAQDLLNSSADLALKGDFFENERLLIQVRLWQASEQFSSRLQAALEVSRTLGTGYQECQLLLAIASVRCDLNDLKGANAAARAARRIARTKGYRPLAARASLLMGLSAKRDSEKDFAFKKSLHEAAELGLLPLLAKCTYQLGTWRYACGDYLSAQDYFSKSVSITLRLADGLTSADRKSYLSIDEHRRAQSLMEEVSARVRLIPSRLPDLLSRESALFTRLYRLAASMTTAVDPMSAAGILREALKESVEHRAIIVLGTGSRATFYPVRTNLSEDLRRHVMSIAEAAGEKTYLTGLASRKRDTAVWMPILSSAVRGGIYLESLPGRFGLEERDIEFLTILAAVAAAAFDKVYSRATYQPVACREFCGIVGSSKPMEEIRTKVELAATNTATVLIEGESGTGKELVAKAIHECSSRVKGPFVPVDCGALPEELIEAELFGAKKGAYTGAVADRAGLFEAAERGTIFLDEISNLGLQVQAKLLRVLQEREVRKIGSTVGKILDVRLIAATNCNLEELVREGKFRQDLLYRLKVLHIVLPPLRHRKADIPILAARFLERLNARNETTKYFGLGVLDGLMEHDFPGNVRELQNAIERGFYSSPSPLISQIDFFREPGTFEGTEDTERWFKDLVEGRKDFWLAVRERYKRRDIPREKLIALVDLGLKATRGNYRAMASMLQIPKQDYRRFMDFLRRSRCLLDFRPYRKASGVVAERLISED